jgi:hypothetical protein
MALTLIVETRCPGCGLGARVEVDAEGYAAWRGGELIHRALPLLSDSERERLITGLCDPCWDKWTEAEEWEKGEP